MVAAYKWDLVWYNISILTVWHIGAVYGFYRLVTSSSPWIMLGLFLSLWWFSGLGITAGAHRLWAHRSYKATAPYRAFIMLCNSMAFQGSIYEWSRDHRVHHKASETDADPHNATRGMFFAHMGWVMVRKHPEVKKLGQKLSMADLDADAVVIFQKKHYFITVLSMCYGLPTLLGYLAGSAHEGFWIGGVFRHVWVLHMTWLVNSVAHFYGYRPYDPKINPVENLLVSIGAIGEGWHNFHHTYPYDYAAGEWGLDSGVWNPTKLFIDIAAALGMVSDRKRAVFVKRSEEAAATKKASMTEAAAAAAAARGAAKAKQGSGKGSGGSSVSGMVEQLSFGTGSRNTVLR